MLFIRPCGLDALFYLASCNGVRCEFLGTLLYALKGQHADDGRSKAGTIGVQHPDFASPCVFASTVEGRLVSAILGQEEHHAGRTAFLRPPASRVCVDNLEGAQRSRLDGVPPGHDVCGLAALRECAG